MPAAASRQLAKGDIMDSLKHELPSMVATELERLPPPDQAAFWEEYERRRKSSWWAWPLWFIGWHIGYIEGRWGFNVLYWLAIAPTLGIWWLIEAFRVNKRLRNQRRAAAIDAMRDLKIIGGAEVPAAAG
jgi:hypothetical protein